MIQTNEFDLKYGIESDDLNEIVQVIKQNKKITQIIHFSSRAKGNFRQGSDLDLALIASDLTLDELLDIKVNLYELMLPFNVDLVNYNKISNNDLLEHINRIGKLICC
jgi:predicted nucleotidyltransferase